MDGKGKYNPRLLTQLINQYKKALFMEKKFVIEKTIKWTKKDGTPVESKSYFQQFTGWPLPLIHLSNLEDCKKYNSRAEALIDWRKYYSRNENVKIIPLSKLVKHEQTI